jgi:GT2 family glycosyltransferase
MGNRNFSPPQLVHCRCRETLGKSNTRSDFQDTSNYSRSISVNPGLPRRSQKLGQMDKFQMVSIIISNHNGKDLLKECLSSLMALAYPNFEIIVVDAGSNDGTPEMVRQCFPLVKLVETSEIGIGEAINIGMRNAVGDIIVFDFNNDEIASADWLNQLLNVLGSSSNIGVVGGTRILFGTDGVIDDAGSKIYLFGHMSKIGRLKKFAGYAKDPKEVDYVNCIAAKKETIDKVGRLDEQFFIYGEDADFCLRAKKAGYRIVQVPDAITYHRVSAIIGQETPRQVYYNRRAQIRVILKHFSAPRKMLALPWIALMTAVDASMLCPFF